MANGAVGLPPGFVLDDVDASTGLPAGFELDDLPKDFGGRMAADILKRGSKLNNALQHGVMDDQDYASTGYQVLAQGGGLLGDLFGNAVGSAGRSWWESQPEEYRQATMKYLVDPIKERFSLNAKDAAVKAKRDYPKSISKIKGAIEGVEDAWQDFSEEHPTAARNIAATPDALNIIPAGKVAKEGKDIAGGILQATGEALKDSAASSITKALEESALPKLTQKESAKRIKSGLSEKGSVMGIETGRIPVYKLNDVEKHGVVEAQKMGLDIKPTNAAAVNADILTKAVSKEAEVLQNSPMLKDTKIPVRDYKDKLNGILKEINADESFNASDKKVLRNKIIDMKNSVGDTDISASDLLEKRKNFDKRIEIAKQRKKENKVLYNNGLRKVREATNDFIADNVPDVAVKDSLKRQNGLYAIRDNYLTKVSDDPKTVGNILSNKINAETNIGLVARAPFVAVKELKNLLASPKIREITGISLSKTGDFIKGGKKLTPYEANTVMQKYKLLPAPNRAQPNTILGSGRTITDTAFPIEELPK